MLESSETPPSDLPPHLAILRYQSVVAEMTRDFLRERNDSLDFQRTYYRIKELYCMEQSIAAKNSVDEQKWDKKKEAARRMSRTLYHER